MPPGEQISMTLALPPTSDIEAPPPRAFAKVVIYASFVAGIISVNLSLLGQVPRKVYNIIHGIESDELLLEAQAMAKEFDRELEAEAAKDSDDNADNVGKDGGKKE